MCGDDRGDDCVDEVLMCGDDCVDEVLMCGDDRGDDCVDEVLMSVVMTVLMKC
jgi:hypothetical protein